MTDKFKNKYTIQSARLAGYNYSQNGMYFVTICARDREHFFGEVENRKMNLSDIGKIAEQFWQEIPGHFPFVNLDKFVIMPNHIHGIIEINKNENFVETQNLASQNGKKAQCVVEAQNFASLRSDMGYKNKFGPQSKNLSSIVRGFKAGVKKYATMNDIDFQWQSRFYDHIIRNDESLNKIREYIQINPEMWERDRNNLENLWI